MKYLRQRAIAWIKENKVLSAVIISLFCGLILLTGAPLWWAPFWNLSRAGWSWALVPHGLPGWLLIILLVGVIPGYVGRAAAFLRRFGSSPASTTSYQEKAQVRPQFENFHEIIEEVLWRGLLHNGRLSDMNAHCPKCFVELKPKDYNGFHETEFTCDGCKDYKHRIKGHLQEIRDRIGRMIVASHIRKWEGVKGLRLPRS